MPFASPPILSRTTMRYAREVLKRIPTILNMNDLNSRSKTVCTQRRDSKAKGIISDAYQWRKFGSHCPCPHSRAAGTWAPPCRCRARCPWPSALGWWGSLCSHWRCRRKRNPPGRSARPPPCRSRRRLRSAGRLPSATPSPGPRRLCLTTHIHTRSWQHPDCWPAPLRAGSRAPLKQENQRELNELMLAHDQVQAKPSGRAKLIFDGPLQFHLSAFLSPPSTNPSPSPTPFLLHPPQHRLHLATVFQLLSVKVLPCWKTVPWRQLVVAWRILMWQREGLALPWNTWFGESHASPVGFIFPSHAKEGIRSDDIRVPSHSGILRLW